jgi:tetratricopeptide (TPR) repeat protein
MKPVFYQIFACFLLFSQISNLCAQTDSAKIYRETEAFLTAAIADFDGKRYQKSLISLDKAIHHNNHPPLQNILYYYKSLTLAQLENFQGALVYMDSAIGFLGDESKPHYYQQRADYYYQFQNWEAALKDYEQVLKSQPQNAHAHVRVGILNLRSNHPAAAIEKFKTGLDLDGSISEGYYYRAFAYFQLIEPQKACADLQKAQALNYPLAQPAIKNYCK